MALRSINEDVPAQTFFGAAGEFQLIKELESLSKRVASEAVFGCRIGRGLECREIGSEPLGCPT
jgi:hypothetical protein